jgi:hypothetical protein
MLNFFEKIENTKTEIDVKLNLRHNYNRLFSYFAILDVFSFKISKIPNRAPKYSVGVF